MDQNKLVIRDSTADSRSSEEVYQEYKPVGNRNFSTRRLLTIHARSDSRADIRFNQVEFDIPMNFPFPVSNNFNRN